MRFRGKVLVALLVAGVLPVAIAGASAFRSNKTQLIATVGALHAQASADLASTVASSLLQSVENLRSAASYLRLSELEPENAEAVLQIPARQFSNVRALCVVDAQGKPLTRTVARSSVSLDANALAAFGAHAPLQHAALSGAAIGAPYRLSDGPHVVIAVETSPDRESFLLADVSLAELEERLQARAADEVAFVVDANGDLVLHSGRPLPTLSEEERAVAAVPGQSRIVVRGGEEYLLVAAPIAELRWSAVTGQKSEAALLPATRVGRYTLFWTFVAVGLTAVVSVTLSRSVSDPLRELMAAVKRVGEGNYDERLQAPSSDEFGELSAAFNQLAKELARRDGELKDWGQKLQQRVDARTRELKEAQEQIIRARKLAAMGSFAAGLSHELNNPLTGVVGVLSVLKMELSGSPSAELVDVALEQAGRMGSVVKNMRETAERDTRNLGTKIPLHRPVSAAVEAKKDVFARRRVRVTTEINPKLPPVLGDAQQLQQVIEQLLQNSVTAMPSGGELRVSLAAIGAAALRVAVSDTGKGIPENIRDRIFDPFFSTKDEPGRMGMGLTVAARIVEAHQGRITVESDVGKGTTFSVFLPAAAESTHLF